MDNKGRFAAFSGQGLLAILVLASGALVLREVTLESSRPAANEPKIPGHYSISLMIMAILSAAIVLICAMALRRAAEKSGRRALKDVDDALLRSNATKGIGDQTRENLSPTHLNGLRDRIAGLDEVAFAPFSQQPLLKALLMPFAAVGGTTVLDYMTLVNL